MAYKKLDKVKRLENKAKILWKKLVLKRCEKKCFVCENRSLIVPHHFVPKKTSLALKFDPENGICLCQKCHIALHWKSDPLITLTIAFKKGKEWVEYLRQKKNETIIMNSKWIEGQIKILQEYANKIHE